VRQLGSFINTRTWRNLRLLFTRCASRQTLHLDPCSCHFRLHMQDGKSYDKSVQGVKRPRNQVPVPLDVLQEVKSSRGAQLIVRDWTGCHIRPRRTRGTQIRFATGGRRACTDHTVTCCRCMLEKLVCGAHNLDWYPVAHVRNSENVSRYTANIPQRTLSHVDNLEMEEDETKTPNAHMPTRAEDRPRKSRKGFRFRLRP
jgi:hypothetical protein